MMTTWALNLASGKLLVALQVLLALGAGEFELAHDSFRMGGLHDVKNILFLQSSAHWKGWRAAPSAPRPAAQFRSAAVPGRSNAEYASSVIFLRGWRYHIAARGDGRVPTCKSGHCRKFLSVR